MEPPSNHLTSPYGSPPGCPPPMYGTNTDYNLQQKMQDQYYTDSRQQNAMGYPMSGQNYPTMGMEQSKMVGDPSGFGAGGPYGPMMRALTEDESNMYNQQPHAQQAGYRQMPGMGGYGQNMNYPIQDSGYGAHTGGGQYPFSPGHSPRSTQFFPMHGQSDGYTSPPAVQSPHFGPTAPLGQYQHQSPLMNMGSSNGQTSPSVVPPYSRPTANHPVSTPSPVMGMQGNSMYSSHTGGNSGHISHNSPLPSPSNLRSPASVHSPKSLPATSPSTFASPSPSPVGTMAGQQTQHRQTRSPSVSGNFQQNQGQQPYPIPSPKVRAVEQTSNVSGNTPYVELVSTRDSPHGSTTSSQSQDSGGGNANAIANANGKAPYPPKEANRGHLPQLQEMVKFLGEPTAKGILYDKDGQPKEPDVNGRSSVDEKVNNSVETDSNKASDHNDSKSVSPANPEVSATSNGPLEIPLAPISEENPTTMQNNGGDASSDVVNNTPNGPENPGKKSPRRRNNSKSPKRRNSGNGGQENHVGNSPRSSVGSPRQPPQTADSDGDAPVRRRRSSSGGERRRQSSGGSNVNQRSPKRRNSRKSDDEAISNEASPKTRLSRSPRRHSLEKHNPHPETHDPDTDNKEGVLESTRTESLEENNPSNGAKSEAGESENNRTIEQKPDISDTIKEEPVHDIPLSGEKTPDVKSESVDTSPMDVPSTSRSETPTFKNPMTTPTSKRNSPETESPLTPGGSKRKGRPVGSKNRTKEEIAREPRKKRPYKRRNINPELQQEGDQPRKKRPYRRRNVNLELQQELGKFKHVAKGGKAADNKQNLQKGPVLRIEGTVNNVISSKVLNCLLDEQSSQNVVGKKKKRPGRVAKRFSSMARAVPHGPATMHASVFRPVGDWVCALCGKPSNYGTLGHLYGPYYPHGYQIPPQPPKTDSTPQTKDKVAEIEPPPSKKGKGRARLKSASPPPPKGRGKGRGAKQQTPKSGTTTTQRPSRNSKGASGKRTPKTSKMEDFEYEVETPVATKGQRRRRSSSTPSVMSVSSDQPVETTTGKKRRGKSLKDDPTRPDPNEMWVHEDCAIWSQGVYAMGSTLYGLYEAVLAAKKVECVKCSKKGASMGCLSRGCKMAYHFMCAQLAGCQLQDENYSMICPQHKDKMVKMRDVT